ncbi:LysR family transcriptional regulator [Citricoccus nitrophenolicus]|nr:LysR family transcriptional regulator [Citricoccus muralis]
MMDLTLRQMEYFLAALDTGSMTKAAKRCHASQSATSMAVAQLERSLGAPLFLRSHGSSLVPTSVALAFAAHARTCVEAAEAAQAAATETLHELSGTLRVGCLHDLAKLVLPPLAQLCDERYPQLELQLVEGSAVWLQEEMRAGRFDLALVYSLQVGADLSMTPLREVRLHAVLPAGHPAAQRESVDWGQIAAEPAILLDGPPAVERITAQAHRLGLELNIRWTLSSMETIRSLVARGLGYSLTNAPPASATTVDGLEVVYKPLANDLLPNHLCALHAPGAERLRKIRAVMELIKEATRA